jgi:flagellar biosynthesis/type III secretory pathway protein FliH
MKSSCKVIRAGEASEVLAWDPEAFQLAAEEKGLNLADVLALFRAQPLPAEQENTTGEPIPRMVASETQAPRELKAWSPEELDWVSPFTSFTVWDTSEPEEARRTAQPEPAAPREQAEALALVEEAQRQAGEIILQAQRSADEALRQAQEQIRQATQAGYQQGWEAALAEASISLQAAQQIIAELKTWRDGMLAGSEPVVIDIIRQIAQAMFGQGVALDEKALQDNLNRLLENAKSLGELKIFLNPDDAARLDPAWRETQSLIIGNKVFIIPSEGTKPGGAFIQGQMGSVDATVDTQLKSLLDVFTTREEPAEAA